MATKKKPAKKCKQFFVGVETPHGVPSRRYKGFTSLAAATKRAQRESRQGYQAVVAESCATRPHAVVVCNAGKCLNLDRHWRNIARDVRAASRGK